MLKRIIENISLQHFGGIGNDDQSLTGSCHNLIVEYMDGTETSIIVDMGAFQGLGQDLNPSLPFDADKIHAVIITHGHIDHCGRLPMLFNQKKPFHGDVYASELTKKVAHTALLDSAKIFATEYEKEKRKYDKFIEECKEARRTVANYEATGVKRDAGGNRNENHDARPSKEAYDVAKKLLREQGITREQDIYTKIQKPLLPIFTSDDVETAVQGTIEVEFSEEKKLHWQEICPEVSFSLWNAGHVAGSASVLFRIAAGKAKMKYYFFSGDLGPARTPIHPFGLAEVPNLPIDMVVMETTYGDKVRTEFDVGYREFEESVIKASTTRDRLIIPSFALDRAQMILFLLVKMRKEGKFQGKIFLDSPLATVYTDLYQQHGVLGSGMDELKSMAKTFSLIDATTREGVLAEEDFKIIVTSSGMATGGPIMTHLLKYLADIRTTFFFMGYMAEGTLGRDLTDEIKPKKLVRLPDVEYPIEVLARVKRFNFLSGHMDQKDLWEWYKKLHLRPGARVVLVHGERDSSTLAFKHFLGRRKIDYVAHKGITIPEVDKILVPDVNQIYSVF
ncbi:MAG: hypothetical protein ACD_78C00006G0004 [uncultured bacterium (gcode 4)]|uniref:Beta-Casp domain-containing protein n=1 Tax=uncultured bacterium (gcode 4) TaxID=1234023 RepID=K1XJL8_9BACT|nr:MAG: hypothetical protein ACD_78C00006G0004 [uncultured bacterium (gcode 4)]HBB27393.1 hypothetical protein [Candidatus Gracilibacteria bacterium]